MNNRVLIADDEDSVRRLLYEVCRKAGYDVHLAENGQEALEKTRKLKPAALLMDIKMPIMDGMEVFNIIRNENMPVVVILMTAFGTVDLAVEAMQKGAFDYIVKPSNIADVRKILERAFQIQWHNEAGNGPDQPQHEVNFSRIIGQSVVMQEVYKKVGRVAPTNATVLITGDSGSGKELIARTIHKNSPRREGPFIMVNSGALPDTLMESELFGYEKGAFTGALTRKLGRFELAHQGTLFLDEVGDLSPTLQVKLLRFLQEREFERVGGIETIKVDVRIIAATNRDLEELVNSGVFRQDLYYRLNVVPIHVPSLRERREDIPLLVDYFIKRFASGSGIEEPYVTPEAMKQLVAHDWPGNVRELGNVLERAVIMSGGMIEYDDVPRLKEVKSRSGLKVPETGTLREIIEQVERMVIAKALAENNFNRVKTSQVLDISRRTLQKKIEEYGLGSNNPDPNEKAE